MIPSASAISETAISALPESAYNNGVATLRSRMLFEAVAISPYRTFVTDTSKQLVYALEIGRHRIVGST